MDPEQTSCRAGYDETTAGKFPCTPRRTLADVMAKRSDRRAQREQRCLEVELQLRKQLGLIGNLEHDDDHISSCSTTPTNGASHDTLFASGVRKSAWAHRSPEGPCNKTNCVLSTCSASPCNSMEEPCQQQTVTTHRTSCPSRPPKPKPHRPLSWEPPVTQVVPAERRWKSALLPEWSDQKLPDDMSEFDGVPSLGEGTCTRVIASSAKQKDSVDASVIERNGYESGVQFLSGESVRQRCRSTAANVGIAAAAVATAAKKQQEVQVAERARLLEKNTQRLREAATRLPGDVRRRVDFANESKENCPQLFRASSLPAKTSRQIAEMRRKIIELDEINAFEHEKLICEQRAVEERRRQQEEFERSVVEQRERSLREHEEAEARKEAERSELEEKERRQFEERESRRLEQQHREEKRSKCLDEKRREGRSETAQKKWQEFEEELDRQWAKQEQDERERLSQYAKERHRQYEDLDQKLRSERRRLATDAEFSEAAHFQRAHVAARRDEQVYVRPRPNVGRNAGGRGRRSPFYPPQPPPKVNGNGTDTKTINSCSFNSQMNMIPEEHAALTELQSVCGDSRNRKKAIVKQLLFKWHPDKNPECTELATRLFQFVQRQKELVLDL